MGDVTLDTEWANKRPRAEEPKEENCYLRFLGVAVAMAAADGEIEPAEREVIEYIGEQVGLPIERRGLIDELIAAPPDEKQIARWTAEEGDRIAVYAVGLRVAQADDKLRLQESRMLDRLRRYLALTPDQITRAKQQAAEARL